MVGGSTVHFGSFSSAPEITASDNDAYFDAEIFDLLYFVGNGIESFSVYSVALIPGESFARKFD